MATRKYVSLSKLSTFLDNLKGTFASLIHTHKLEDITDYSVDDTLSDVSTNPVQNKVINEAITTLNDSVTEQINTATEDVITIDGGATASTLADIFGEPPYTIEFTDELEELSNITVAAGTDYETYRLRNVAIVTEVPTQMNDGDIALVIKSGG